MKSTGTSYSRLQGFFIEPKISRSTGLAISTIALIMMHETHIDDGGSSSSSKSNKIQTYKYLDEVAGLLDNLPRSQLRQRAVGRWLTLHHILM